jgi:hypothetical protein
MQKKTVFIFMAATAFLFSGSTGFSSQETGASSIVLEGGSLGNIVFPHGRHQGFAVDCRPCHELFPQESNAINKMKAAGTLQKKDVMNLCKGCHTDLAAKGEKAGPVACNDCHKK